VRALAGETVRGALVLSEDRYSGEQRLVAIDAVPMHDGGDDLVERVLLVFHDVSDEQARLHALEAERQRTERLISDAPHGVAVLDLAGRVLQVNDSLAAMAGRTVEDVVGMAFGDLSPTHRDKMAVYLERAVAFPGELLVGDWTIESLDGSDAHVSLTSRVLSSPDEEDEVILVNVVDFSERRRYEERLTYLADHDALTAMPNRRRFDQALEEHLRLCARRGPSGALLLLDLDNFKEVNDTMGHTAGDELIVSISTVVRDSLRGGDLVARLGGDEFAVLLPDADQAGAESVARMLVERVRAHCQSLDGAKRRVTVSVGAVTFAAATQQAVDPLALADMLLYDAKEAGRNRHAVLDPSGTEQPRSGARLEWMARIEAAIENDAFELYLQPILDVRSNRVVAAEALLRLVDRDGAPVSPGRFVHVAERAGLAPELDKWVIRHAVATLSRLHQHEPELVLEVNLSGHSIGDESVEREFVEALHRHGVSAHKFVVEATETAAVADVPAARAFSQRLGAMGTRVAIDDFGAGFGSFYYLKHLPFDIVKIDGEFVAGAHTSAVDRAILRSIVGVARNLGKETVAEFVAEAAVLDVVRELGVDYAQGYYIGEPVPFDTFVSRHLHGGSSQWTTSGSLATDSPSALLVGGDLT
jgi:diguanylate cyclase (GGDEF)-like protein/PAS domain S-box-containing protein